MQRCLDRIEAELRLWRRVFEVEGAGWRASERERSLPLDLPGEVSVATDFAVRANECDVAMDCARLLLGLNR
jgi:hypothetical protein